MHPPVDWRRTPDVREIASCRQIIIDEDVPVEERCLSVFEDNKLHCEGGHHMALGHTINLTGSRSNLIFDWNQQRGNPADIDHLRKILDSFSFCSKISPRDVPTDVACASKANLFGAKAPGII